MIDLHERTEPPFGVIKRPIGEITAGEPAFAPGLAYTPPARGHWTIAHTPMLIPESYMIYLCASACIRGVVMSALEDGGMDRFSMIVLDDRDIYEGNLEKVMIDGISQIIDGLDSHPPLVMPFTSCIHHFIACDSRYIYSTLRKKYPDIDFVECFMIPTIRKGRVSPEEQMQINLYDPLEEEEKDPRSVNVIGGNFETDPENDFMKMFAENGYNVRDLVPMKKYSQYKDMAKSSANIYMLPVASLSAKKLEKRLGQKAVYLPVSFDGAVIRLEMKRLSDLFGMKLPDLDTMEEQAETALGRALEVIGDTPVSIDHEAVPLPCSLAKMLAEHGFSVKEIYADAVPSGDGEALSWLAENRPDVELCSTNTYGCRLAERKEAAENGGRVLAIGQKAAYFTGTKHFVNILEAGGLWGFHGIEKLAEMMIDAFENEKDTKAVIEEKAFGCACMIEEKQRS